MRNILLFRAIWMSLGVLVLSTLGAFVVSLMVRVPSVPFDLLTASLGIAIAGFAAEWYLQAPQLERGTQSGFLFGLMVLATQFLAGIALGVAYNVFTIKPIELSAHPTTMFILIIVLTLSTTSRVGNLAGSN